MDLGNEASLMECILFLEGDPVDEQSLARISGLAKDVVEGALQALKDRLDSSGSGLELTQVAGGWCLHPRKDYWECLRVHYGKKNDQKLSRAALETLSIIAYSQPITRAEVEAIRGVSADNMIRLLLDRELIREAGKKDVPGKPTQYGTTREFLKYFKISSIAELPKLDDFEEERFELEPEA